VLKRFPGHWNAGNYHFDRVTYLPMPNSSVRLANLQAGSLDMAFIAPTDVAAVKKDSRLNLTMWDALGYTGINFNIANGPAANTLTGQHALVRQAFELALDRQAISDVVFAGMLTPTAQANIASSPFHVPSVQPPARDIAKAKALLAQAGITGRVPVELTVTNAPEAQQAAEVIQSMVAEAGFDMKIEVQENATRSKRQQDGDFEAGFSFWSGRVDPDGNIGNRATCGAANNDAHYCNPEVKEWIDSARKLADSEARKKLYSKVTAQLAKDRPILFIWHRNVITAFNKKLQGFEQYSDGLIRLNGVKFDSKS